jgi:tyrosyl-tRNA synthetase
MGERIVEIPAHGAKLAAVIVEIGFAESNSAATRLIEQGSVRMDGERVTDRGKLIQSGPGSFVLQVGKRKVVRVTLSDPNGVLGSSLGQTHDGLVN